VNSSLLSAMVAMMDFQAARWLVEKDVPGQAGNDHPTSMPTSVYPTADGYVNIAASGNPIFKRMCEAFGDPGLAKKPEFANAPERSANRVALNEAIAAHSRRYRSAELIELLAAAGVPCGPIYKMDQVFDDPQVRHLGLAVTVPRPEGGALPLVGPAMTLSRTPARMKRTAAASGEHNDGILRELGYGDAEIARLRAEKVI
jgi:formyl-CoA transferase